MRSFITGSYAYGKPKPESDIDLVIYVNYTTKERLIKLSDYEKMPCKFGRLNLIFATSEEEYAAWLLGKILCVDDKPNNTNKEINNKHHDKARNLFGTTYDHDSGKSELE